MHDLDPHHQSQQRDPLQGRHSSFDKRLAESNDAPDRTLGRLADERVADLSELDDAGIETEARREVLRDQRQARRQKKATGKLDNWQQAVLLGLLVFAAVVAMAVAVVGLTQENADVIRAGLLALCAVCGGAFYRLSSMKKRPKGRKS